MVKNHSINLKPCMRKNYPLFVFSINGLKQNAKSLLTLVSDTDFYALEHGSLHFVPQAAPITAYF